MTQNKFQLFNRRIFSFEKKKFVIPQDSLKVTMKNNSEDNLDM